jgi:hypothetical protein
MPRQYADHSRPVRLEFARPLRRWDRQLVWLSAIGFSTLTWTALALLALRTI